MFVLKKKITKNMYVNTYRLFNTTIFYLWINKRSFLKYGITKQRPTPALNDFV